MMRRYTIDLEFAEKPTTIELISIAVVGEDGREYYAENSEFSGECNEWVREHVLDRLIGGDTLRTLSQIAEDIRQFVGSTPEFWGYYSAYDWVRLCWLYGPMVNLPDGWPMLCLDLEQEFRRLGSPDGVKPHSTLAEHSALADARWNMAFLLALDEHEEHGHRWSNRLGKSLGFS